MIEFVIIVILIEVIFKPRLDLTDDLGLLWYGRNNRKFIELYRKNE